MSDKSNKPPSSPKSSPGSTARSGTAGSIGAELGGDLDFEPDALLDSLLAEDPEDGPAPAEPVEPTKQILAPAKRSFPADDVTGTFKVDGGEYVSTSARISGEEDATVAADLSDLDSGSTDDELTVAKSLPDLIAAARAAEQPPPSSSRDADAAALTPDKLPETGTEHDLSTDTGDADELTVARPLPPSIPRPAVPRPIAPAPEKTRVPPAVNPAGPPPREPFPLAQSAEPPSTQADASAPDDAVEDDVVDEDIDELLDLDPDADIEEIPTEEPEQAAADSAATGAAPSLDVSDDGDEPEFDVTENPSEVDPLEYDAVEGPQDEAVQNLAQEQEPWPELEDDRPASTHLVEQDQLEAFIDRARLFEAEAASAKDPQAKCRALVVASELWSMAGEPARAAACAADATKCPGAAPLAVRQARWTHKHVDPAAAHKYLETETRSGPTPAGRVHGALLAAETARLIEEDDRLALKRVELAARASSADVRAHIAKLAAQLAESSGAPKLRLPDAESLAELGVGLAELSRLRADERHTPPARELSAAATVAVARRALQKGDAQTIAPLLQRLAATDDLVEAVAWVATGLLAPVAATRQTAIDILMKSAETRPSAIKRRTLARLALENGDASTVADAIRLDDSDAPALGPADRLALAALCELPAEQLSSVVAGISAESEAAPLAAAASVKLDEPVYCGAAASQADARLGRAFARLKTDADLEKAAQAYLAARQDSPLARGLSLEVARAAKDGEGLARVIAAWPSDGEHAEVHRQLAVGLVHELSGNDGEAEAAYRAALKLAPSNMAAVRAVLPRSADAAADLALASERSEDTDHRALLLFEAAIRRGTDDLDGFARLLEASADTAPDLPFAYRVGILLGRMAGNVEQMLAWVHRRRDHVEDAYEKAIDLVREALLGASDIATTAGLLETALEARPDDVALRELHERLSSGLDPKEGAAWREAAAEHASGQAKVRLLVTAAREFERADDFEAAARVAMAAVENGGGDFARLASDRAAARSTRAATLAEQLLERARAAQDVVDERELYTQLSELDGARGDQASAVLWQSAILERSPDNLPALRRLEHAYIGSGRDDDLEGVASWLSRLTRPTESTAHAVLASRLRSRSGEWADSRELVERAFDEDPPSLWAMRAMSAHATYSKDYGRALRAFAALRDGADRSLDAATLSLRAAQAAIGAGQSEEALEHLERAVELAPDHRVALEERAKILAEREQFAEAAEALETLAQVYAVDAHQVDAWEKAGNMWLDHADDPARGRLALEKACQLDIARESVFERLQALYVALSDRAAIADLLERRLAETSDPQQRVALEVRRGRALADIGDKAAAKAALSSALDANPDHAGALSAFADLAAEDEDWPATEQALIRLARHTSDATEQSAIYQRLAELYDEHLPNPERAESAYREVLKRDPSNAAAKSKLITVYGRLGRPDDAMALANELLSEAESDEEKRDRTIELALALEQIVGDKRKAESTLEKARKTWPHDGVALSALAEFYARNGEHAALKVLLNRAANDARRALGTGRFEPGFFDTLASVADLRGQHDAAHVARATRAALTGTTPLTVRGAGAQAGKPELDDLLAPDLLTLPLRTLFKRAGGLLDAAYPMDLRAMRATPLPQESAEVLNQIQQMAAGFGIHNIEVFVTSSLGAVCTPVSSAPPQLLFGKALLDSDDHAARFFLILRALKVLQLHGSALARTAPIDLWPVMAAFLSLHATSWQPQGVDAKKFAAARSRIQGAMTSAPADDLAMIALEVIGSIGNRATQLATSINELGNRAALLGVGDPMAAIRALALAGGHTSGPPAEGADRLRWIVRNAEARDLAVFSVGEGYMNARDRFGLSE